MTSFGRQSEVVKPIKDFLKRFTSQRSIGKIYSYKFPKVKALRKKRSGAYYEEVCLKFSQAEGNSNTVLGEQNLLPQNICLFKRLFCADYF